MISVQPPTRIYVIIVDDQIDLTRSEVELFAFPGNDWYMSGRSQGYCAHSNMSTITVLQIFVIRYPGAQNRSNRAVCDVPSSMKMSIWATPSLNITYQRPHKELHRLRVQVIRIVYAWSKPTILRVQVRLRLQFYKFPLRAKYWKSHLYRRHTGLWSTWGLEQLNSKHDSASYVCAISDQFIRFRPHLLHKTTSNWVPSQEAASYSFPGNMNSICLAEASDTALTDVRQWLQLGIRI